MTFNVFLSFSLSLGLHNNQRVLLMPSNLKSFCHNRFVHGEQIDFSLFTPSLGNCTRGVISESHHRLCFYSVSAILPWMLNILPGLYFSHFFAVKYFLLHWQNVAHFRLISTKLHWKRTCTTRWGQFNINMLRMRWNRFNWSNSSTRVISVNNKDISSTGCSTQRVTRRSRPLLLAPVTVRRCLVWSSLLVCVLRTNKCAALVDRVAKVAETFKQNGTIFNKSLSTNR